MISHAGSHNLWRRKTAEPRPKGNMLWQARSWSAMASPQPGIYCRGDKSRQAGRQAGQVGRNRVVLAVVVVVGRWGIWVEESGPSSRLRWQGASLERAIPGPPLTYLPCGTQPPRWLRYGSPARVLQPGIHVHRIPLSHYCSNAYTILQLSGISMPDIPFHEPQYYIVYTLHSFLVVLPVRLWTSEWVCECVSEWIHAFMFGVSSCLHSKLRLAFGRSLCKLGFVCVCLLLFLCGFVGWDLVYGFWYLCRWWCREQLLSCSVCLESWVLLRDSGWKENMCGGQSNSPICLFVDLEEVCRWVDSVSNADLRTWEVKLSVEIS